MAWYTTKTTTAPITATKRLYRLSPVTPVAPNLLNNHPPTTAPTTPSTTSTTNPSPLRFTSLLPMKPAINPKIIQAINDMDLSSRSSCLALQTVRIEARPEAL